MKNGRDRMPEKTRPLSPKMRSGNSPAMFPIRRYGAGGPKSGQGPLTNFRHANRAELKEDSRIVGERGCEPKILR